MMNVTIIHISLRARKAGKASTIVRRNAPGA